MRLKSSVIAAIIMLILGLIISVVNVACQYAAAKPKDEPNIHEPHKSLEDFEDSIGYRYVEAMGKDDRLLFYTKEYKNRVHLGSFGYDKTTRIVGNYEGKLCVLSCRTHTFALVVAPCGR